MKLSDKTIKVLKNFSTINQGLIVKPGKTIRTISANKAILAEASIEEQFDSEFGIYDLNKTLSLLSLTSDNEVEIAADHLEFLGLNGSGKIRQRFTPSNLILGPPDKKIAIDEFVCEFELSVDILNWIFSVANVLKCPNIVINSQKRSVEVCATDVKGAIVDDAKVKIPGVKPEIDFSIAIKMENLKIIPQTYTVHISNVGVCKLTDEDETLTYWIALEQNHSTFQEK